MKRLTSPSCPYNVVKPIYRTFGIGLLGLCLGRVRLANGESGIALVYKLEDKVIVIRYDDQVFVISYSGVEKAYRELMEAVTSWKTSHGQSTRGIVDNLGYLN